jgi:hypothetical protein
MNHFPKVHSSETKMELIQQVKEVNDFLYQFYKDSPDLLFESSAVPEGWSIRRNLKHCTSSNYIFGWWIGLPVFILKLLGKPKIHEISIEAIKGTNRFGITDYGKYIESDKTNPLEKQKLLEEFNKSRDYFIKKIESKSIEELNSCKAMFGGYSLRMFCLFTLKHNLHHTNVVNIRLNSI